MGGVDFRNRATGWGYGLVGCYFVAFVVTVVQIALIAVRGARIKSFHGAFLVLTSLWLPLRVLVLVLTPEDGDDDTGIDTIEVLYYLPTVLQFASFSLWGLFLHSASRHQLGLQTSWHMIAWYGVPNGVLFLANVAEIVVAVESVRDGALANDVRLIQNAFRGMVYTLLAGVVATYGWRFSRLQPHQYHRTLLPRRPALLHAVNIALVALFVMRAGYDFVSLGAWHIPAFPPVEWYTLLFFLLAELLPLALLLLVLPMPSSGKETSNQWEDRFIVHNPGTPSIYSDSGDGPRDALDARMSNGRGPPAAALVDGQHYGDEAALFLFATDDSIRRGFQQTSHGVAGSSAFDSSESRRIRGDSSHTYTSRGSLSTSRDDRG